jgi:hypothetical protein
MKSACSLLSIGLAVVGLTASAHAAIVSIIPIADAFLTGGSADPGAGSPTGNYGGAGALQISAAGSTKGEIQSLLKYDLAAAKATFDSTFGAGNWLVSSVTLQLGTNFGTQGAQPNNAIFNTINVGLFKIDWLANDNWLEGTGTPAGPTTDGVSFSSLALLISAADRTLGTFTYTPVGNTNPPTVQPATYALSLDASFLADVSAGNNVSLRAYAGDVGVSYLFNSRSFGTTANRPTLIVNADAVPEPGTSALLTGAVAVLLARRPRYVRGA